jgi:O-antigen ligase
MTSIIQNSFLWRGVTIFAFAIQTNWQKSLIYRIISASHQLYLISLTKRLWIGFCGARDNTAGSIYGGIMRLFRQRLFAIGNHLSESFFYRVIIWLRDLYFRITKGSLVFSWIHKLSLHQWLLVAFVLYLPISFIMRYKISIPFLASVWEELFILISVAFIVWRQALKQTKATDRETPLDGYLILFMSVGLFLMSAVNPYPAVAFDGYRAVVEYMLWFFIIVRLIEDDRDFKVLYYTFLGLGALLCLHGIYQYIVAVPIPASWVSHTEMGVRTRVFSLTGSPNIFGSLIVLLAPMAAAMIYYSKQAWVKLAFCCLTVMMCLCLLFTFSRGAWVGMVVAVILFALYVDRRLLGLMAMAVAAVLLFVPSITSRLTYLFTSDYAEASAIGGRSLRWATGKMLLMENNPFLGFGLGRFGGAVAMNNQLLDETEEFSYFYMDNYYLKTMVEMGYLGIIFYCLLIAALLVWGLRAIYRSGLGYVAAIDVNI